MTTTHTPTLRLAIIPRPLSLKAAPLAPLNLAERIIGLPYMKNLEISKRLGAAKHTLHGAEQYGLKEECRKYASLLVEARPGRFVRAEAIALLKRVGGSVRA